MGTCYRENVIIYVGELLNYKFHGIGVYYSKSGEIIYEGEFVNGTCQGYGTWHYSNGKKIHGEFYTENHRITCKETCRFSKETYNIYKIDKTKNNLMPYSGQSTLYYPTGEIQYEGDFSKGQCEGIGTWFSIHGDKIHGEFYTLASFLFCKGSLEYSTGATAKGEFKFFNLMNEFRLNIGTGAFFNRSRELQYDGDFYNEESAGNGICYFGNGNKAYGKFYKVNGILFCEGSLELSSGFIINGNFKIIFDSSGKILDVGLIVATAEES
jgi:hypothetical protein